MRMTLSKPILQQQVCGKAAGNIASGFGLLRGPLVLVRLRPAERHLKAERSSQSFIGHLRARLLSWPTPRFLSVKLDAAGCHAGRQGGIESRSPLSALLSAKTALAVGGHLCTQGTSWGPPVGLGAGQPPLAPLTTADSSTSRLARALGATFLALPRPAPLMVQQWHAGKANRGRRSCRGAPDDALELGQTLAWANRDALFSKLLGGCGVCPAAALRQLPFIFWCVPNPKLGDGVIGKGSLAAAKGASNQTSTIWRTSAKNETLSQHFRHADTNFSYCYF
eukprot:1006448-Pelagomonas_calceolata.AAC.7